MLLLEIDNVCLKRLQLLCPDLEICLQGGLTNDSCFLLQPLVRFLEVLTFLLKCTELILYLSELNC